MKPVMNVDEVKFDVRMAWLPIPVAERPQRAYRL
jgi:hypothetical protein